MGRERGRFRCVNLFYVVAIVIDAFMALYPTVCIKNSTLIQNACLRLTLRTSSCWATLPLRPVHSSEPVLCLERQHHHRPSHT